MAKMPPIVVPIVPDLSAFDNLTDAALGALADRLAPLIAERITHTHYSRSRLS
jgi:hypothetical protein